MAIKPQFIARLLKVKQRPNQNENKQMHQMNTAKSFGIFVCFFISSVECKTKDKIQERKKHFEVDNNRETKIYPPSTETADYL